VMCEALDSGKDYQERSRELEFSIVTLHHWRRGSSCLVFIAGISHFKLKSSKKQ